MDPGREATVGSWQDWGCSFDLLYSQKRWDGAVYHVHSKMMQEHKGVVNQTIDLRLYHTMDTMQKTVDIEVLVQYSAGKTDRRQDMLQAYLIRHFEKGVRKGCKCTITVQYYNQRTTAG